MAAGLRIGTRNVHVATVIMIIDVFRRNKVRVGDRIQRILAALG